MKKSTEDSNSNEDSADKSDEEDIQELERRKSKSQWKLFKSR